MLFIVKYSVNVEPVATEGAAPGSPAIGMRNSGDILSGMDIERTMEFILKSQARAELRMEKADLRMEKAELRMDRTDKQIDAIRKILQQGVRMLAKTDVRLAELAQAQRATEKSLKAFIDSQRHGRNGRNGKSH